VSAGRASTTYQWIARYKKDGIKGLNEKPHTGRIGLFAKRQRSI
jgi:transposase